MGDQPRGFARRDFSALQEPARRDFSALQEPALGLEQEVSPVSGLSVGWVVEVLISSAVEAHGLRISCTVRWRQHVGLGSSLG